MRLLIIIICITFSVPAFAAKQKKTRTSTAVEVTNNTNDRLIKIESRPDATISFYYMKRDGAKATVILLSGGDGDIKVKNGVPTSGNFLVRSRNFLAENGLNVAVFDKKDAYFRASSEHVDELRLLVAYLKQDANVPVWLVGTSRGTISATAVAKAVSSDELAGIVLTSSITSKEPGAVPFQKLDAIRVPVLVVHNEQDECKVCDPREVEDIFRRLKNAPVKKLVFVKAGSATPSGDPCQAFHYHGFIGVEKDVIDLISAWIKNPVP